MAPEARRERLLRISSSATVQSASGLLQNRAGSSGGGDHSEQGTIRPSRARGDSVATETTSLASRDDAHSYGTVQAWRRKSNNNNPTTPTSVTGGSRRFLHALHRTASQSPAASLFSPRTLRGFRGLSSARPISAYDPPRDHHHTKDGSDEDQLLTSEQDAKINGIRVWYSSYTSIDWLHDAIKDSLRYSKLRKRKSIRAQARLVFDKSQGWIIVTIVGFLSAVVAFLVVRSEQLLFDFKEGYCAEGWWKARRFCCPIGAVSTEPEFCDAWKTWSEVFEIKGNDEDFVEYISYTTIAVSSSLNSSQTEY
jgi:chloride channel 3/4/5